MEDKNFKRALLPSAISVSHEPEWRIQETERDIYVISPLMPESLYGDWVGYGKPEEAVDLRALEALDLAPDAVWSVGDNLEWDVSAPQWLGMFGIWHDVLAQGLPSTSPVIPDRIITSIAELMA